uniref:Ferredoxin reductase n=2 Tax=Bacillati TaxID=1783272 RepID=A0A6J4HM66_9BACT|nr:Ferredoxin reductase [uncultured Armatimonadetes bacterium]
MSSTAATVTTTTTTAAAAGAAAPTGGAAAPGPDPRSGFVFVAPLEELLRRGVIVVRGADRPVAVFAHDDGKVSAVDNRCPHLGFPLSRGTVRDGILTCHWHQARFDLCSGCTFDLFADDVPAYDVEIRDGQVYVGARPRRGDAPERFRRRLEEGMEQNIGLIQAKSVVGLLRAGVDHRDVVRQVARFGARGRDSWGGGMTSLTALANLVPLLDDETAYLALYQGAVRVAEDCAGQPPRRERRALDTDAVPMETLKRWLLHWVTARHRDGAERTLQTAVAGGAEPAALCDLLFTAATERFYADGGHALDFCNKAAELLDVIGWEHAAEILPAVVGQIVSARGGEEMSHWRYPIDLVPALEQAAHDLPGLLGEGESRTWDDVPALAGALLGEDPLAIIETLREAVRAGARPAQFSRALAYAAALRVARFGTANETGDWVTVLHTFTYCNAVHQAAKRCPTPAVARGVFHGAMAVYFDRFLNVPPARLPGERGGDGLEDEPRDGPTLLTRFLDALDGQQKVQAAARAVARYLELGHPLPPLFDALTRAAVREDANFHTLQMLEAGVAQYREWEGRPEGAHILIAVARYLAAHAPTPRARLQTAQIALRLHRGDNLYEETDATASGGSGDGQG